MVFMDHFRFVVNQTMAAKSWTAYGGAKFTADVCLIRLQICIMCTVTNRYGKCGCHSDKTNRFIFLEIHLLWLLLPIGWPCCLSTL